MSRARRHHGVWASLLVILMVQLQVQEGSAARRHKRPEFCKQFQGSEDGSFLWTVGTDPPSYLFGTIHVPYTRVWDDIPDNTKRALHLADAVFFELDLTDPNTISALTSCQLLPKGRSLSDVLPPRLFSRLKRHLAYVKQQMPRWVTPDQRTRGLYADYLFNAITGNWEQKRPVWVMLMVNSLTESDIRSRGVPVLDLFLAQEAERLRKRTGAVEMVEEQCLPLNELNFSQVVFALNHTLTQQESLRAGARLHYTTDDLIRHYNCGDLDAVIFSQDTTQVPQLGNSSLPPLEAAQARHIDDYFRQELIYRRNARMGLRVGQLLRQHPDTSFFFAFGAGHFLGQHTVLDVLRDAGFHVAHVPPDMRLRRHKRRRGHRGGGGGRGGGGMVPELTVLQDFSLSGQVLDESNHADPAFARFLSQQQQEASRRRSQGRGGAPATTPPGRKHAHFNDLWVRIEPHHVGWSPRPPRKEEESLRVWYGLPTYSRGRPAHTSPSPALLTLLICCIALVLPQG